MSTLLKCVVAAVVLFTAPPASAHVKWFSQFSFSDKPLEFAEIATPAFWAMLALSVVVIVLLTYFGEWASGTSWHARIDEWLGSKRPSSLTVMRIGCFSVLLLCWQAGAILVPELKVTLAWVGWYQFTLALLLLFDATVPLAGVGMFGLYLIGVNEYGWFHMLDYVLYLGVAYYLTVGTASNERLRTSALPALYLTVGLSLCWVALEKLVYPKWALQLLEENPVLSLGLPPEFFLVAAAFVELSLGYLLIICLLARPMALTITVVFFLTTLIFGKVEVIGHTMVHAALIVFLTVGPGVGFRPPILLHRRLPVRLVFAGVNFVVLVAVLMIPYLLLSSSVYQQYVGGQ